MGALIASSTARQVHVEPGLAIDVGQRRGKALAHHLFLLREALATEQALDLRMAAEEVSKGDFGQPALAPDEVFEAPMDEPLSRSRAVR